MVKIAVGHCLKGIFLKGVALELENKEVIYL